MVRSISNMIKTVLAYPEAPVTRREMCAFVLRNAFLALCTTGVVVDRCTRFQETAPTTIKPVQDNDLKRMVLSTLEEALQRRLMSARYRPFVETSLRMVKVGRIGIERKRVDGAEGMDHSHLYDSGKNTLFVNTAMGAQDPLKGRSYIIHELYHAYQDYLKKQQRRAVCEAEAHLAGGDYLVFNGRMPNEHWLNLTAHTKNRGKYYISFNVPGSVIISAKGAASSSPAYANALAQIADNYIWISAYLKWYAVYTDAAIRVGRSGLSAGEIQRRRRQLLRDIQRDPKGALKPYTSFEPFFGTSRHLVDRWWVSGRNKEAERLFNQTFIEIRDALRGHIDLSVLNEPVHADGL